MYVCLLLSTAGSPSSGGGLPLVRAAPCVRHARLRPTDMFPARPRRLRLLTGPLSRTSHVVAAQRGMAAKWKSSAMSNSAKR